MQKWELPSSPKRAQRGSHGLPPSLLDPIGKRFRRQTVPHISTQAECPTRHPTFKRGELSMPTPLSEQPSGGKHKGTPNGLSTMLRSSSFPCHEFPCPSSFLQQTSVPFVLGTPVLRGSISAAMRIAWATPCRSLRRCGDCCDRSGHRRAGCTAHWPRSLARSPSRARCRIRRSWRRKTRL